MLPRRDKRTVQLKTGFGGWIAQDGERRKIYYSAAVIDGIKRKSRIFVGDSIGRKTDSRLSKGGRRSLSTESKDGACEGNDRAGHGRWQRRIDTSSSEQRG